MSANSSIEWTDRTWNPVRGCSVISPGCHNCYAMKMAHRFSGAGRPYEGLTKLTERSGPQWTGQIRAVDAALLEPLSWRKPARVFANSMSDLFHDDVPDAFIDRVFAVMAIAQHHTFQILTKRADRMRAYMRQVELALKHPTETFPLWRSEAELILSDRHDTTTEVTSAWPLPNVWLGVSVENQKYADERIPHLLNTPAAVRFISAEPLLGPVQLHIPTRVYGDARPDGSFGCDHCCNGDRCDDATHRDRRHCPYCRGTGSARKLDWVIVGGESGPGARPFDIKWARSIIKQCADADVACFVKQLGAKPWSPGNTTAEGLRQIKDRKGGDMAEWPADLRVREFPASVVNA